MADKISSQQKVEVADIIEISDVLLIGTRLKTTIGRPNIPGAKVRVHSSIYIYIYIYVYYIIIIMIKIIII